MARRMQMIYQGKPRGDWERFPGKAVAKHASHVLRVEGNPAFPGSGVPIVWVLHCGHPTANYPYYLQPTNSPHLEAMAEAIEGAGHKTFGRLVDAKLLAEKMAGRVVRKKIPLSPGRGDPVNCGHCGESFTPKTRNPSYPAKTCSPRCRQAAYRSRLAMARQNTSTRPR